MQDMKRLFFLLSTIIVIGLYAHGQTAVDRSVTDDDNVQLQLISPNQPEEETEQEIKEREKKLREFNDDVAHAKASNSMRRGYFVLVADNVQIGNMGYRHYDISSNSNFILVQDEDGIAQFVLNTGSPGPNGLGGWTGKGKVRNKKIKYADNGDVFMQFQLVGSHVNADVSITLFGNSNRAVARITGGVPITYNGTILPYRDSKHR